MTANDNLKTLMRNSYQKILQMQGAIGQEQARLIGLIEGAEISPEEANEILGAQVMAPVERPGGSPARLRALARLFGRSIQVRHLNPRTGGYA